MREKDVTIRKVVIPECFNRGSTIDSRIRGNDNVASLLAMTLFLIVSSVLSGCRTTGETKTKTASIKSMKPAVDENEVLAANMSFDLDKGEIHYTLPERAFVRVRLGVRDGGAMIRNLVDWELREAGEHVERWDGTQDNGEEVFTRRGDLMAVISALRPLKDNHLPDHSSSVGGLRKSPEFTLSFPEVKDTNSEGNALIRGVATLRVLIQPEDVKWLTESKFEMGMFIDGIFLAEDEEGSNPYNYRLNTGRLNNGLHTITVNVTAYTGEIGSKSLQIETQNK